MRRPVALPQWVQRSALAGLTARERRRLPDRVDPRPPLGRPEHVTAVLRLGADAVPRATEVAAGDRHYVYPPDTVHVTVLSLGRARMPLDAGIATMETFASRAVTLRIDGVGCSPDTMFLRCLHDRAFGVLREQLSAAFDIAPPATRRDWLFDRLSYANIVRFDGPAEWFDVDVDRRTIVVRELEIVRTDRYMSAFATETLARIPLA